MVDQFVFPKEEPLYYSRISLRKYERPKPGSPTQVNLQSSIRLPLPTDLTDSFNINVNDSAKLDLLGNNPTDVLMSGKSKLEGMAKEVNSGVGITSIMKDTALQAAAVMPGISDTGLGTFAQVQTGLVRNPHVTTVFEGVKLKTYSFTWKISPKSADEAQQINSMLTYIKAFIHPLIVGGGFALEFPYIADVKFIVGNNIHLPDVTSSFITRLDINSNASGALAFYKDGQAVSTTIGMSFTEINIKTRDDFIPQSGPRFNFSGLASGSERF